jgi:hypothetical protein
MNANMEPAAVLTLSSSPASVHVPLEEFAEDLDLRLGRANGNVYHRKPGVEGVHDGQVMVRLKKKRFIIIDYGILPTQADLQSAAMHPHMAIPDGAGRTTCVAPHCTKIGVPVLVYDSEPAETPSLYLRSGLCFTCQRNLNEKRRTQRKRKSDSQLDGGDGGGGGGGGTLQKVQHNGQIIQLSPDALVIDGPMDAIKKYADGFSSQEIGTDLHSMMKEALSDTERLLTGVQQLHQHHHHDHTTPPIPTQHQTPQSGGGAAGDGSNIMSNNNSNTSAVAYAAAAAAAVAAVGSSPLNSLDVATTAAVDAAASTTPGLLSQPADNHTNSDDTPHHHHDVHHDVLYEKSFHSMTKALYLLTQWKAAWDATHSQDHPNNDHGHGHDQDHDTSHHHHTNDHDAMGDDQTMMPLLLAADQEGKCHDDTQGQSNGDEEDVFHV